MHPIAQIPTSIYLQTKRSQLIVNIADIIFLSRKRISSHSQDGCNIHRSNSTHWKALNGGINASVVRHCTIPTRKK